MLQKTFFCLLVLCITLLNFNLNAQLGTSDGSIQLQFVFDQTASEAYGCASGETTPSGLCFQLQVQITGDSDGGDNLGTNSIEFSYNSAAMLFDGRRNSATNIDNAGEYTDTQFTNGACTPATAWDTHAFDALIPGSFLITSILNFPDPTFSCPALVNDTWEDYSLICFDVVDPSQPIDIQFLGVQNGAPSGNTNFNTWINDCAANDCAANPGIAQFNNGNLFPFGAATSINDIFASCGIPTMGFWAMITLTLALLSLGTIKVGALRREEKLA